MGNRIILRADVEEALSGNRLDQAAARLFPDYSRARLQEWIRGGSLLVNGSPRKPKDKVFTGDLLQLDAELAAEMAWSPEPQELNIVYEDASLLVIDKPAGSVVHPAAGHRAGTLLNGLLHHCPALELVPRAGIVHRLDKDTTGLMVVAKTLAAHTSLVRQLQAREVFREYEAVAVGTLVSGGVIDLPLGRHPVNRKKRAVSETGKEAITHYSILERYPAHTHVKVRLETGRTHQIRVHFAAVQHPLVGDRVYGGRLSMPAGCSPELAQTLREFGRQALHARSLGLVHPASGAPMSWSSELPDDMVGLLNALERDRQWRLKTSAR